MSASEAGSDVKKVDPKTSSTWLFQPDHKEAGTISKASLSHMLQSALSLEPSPSE